MLSIETGTDLCELLLRLAVCSAAFYTVYFLYRWIVFSLLILHSFIKFLWNAFLICPLDYRLWIDGGVFSNKCDVAGKVAIITGANTGIGKQTAIGLAKYGLHVVLACRDLNRAEAARRDIINITGNPNITCMQLNLSSFKSIRKFADEFSATGMNLDILINNAGVMAVGRQTTEDGLEEHIGINHFGHFLLTMLLLKRLIASTPSRIINVSSWGHRLVKFNRDDLNSEKSYNRFQAYAQSKIANIYFTKALSRRLEDTGVTCNALHPGVTYTDLSGNLSGFSFLLHKWVPAQINILNKICP